jgi:hypothetical protein
MDLDELNGFLTSGSKNLHAKSGFMTMTEAEDIVKQIETTKSCS